LIIKVTGDSLAVIGSWLLAGYLRFYVIPGGRVASFDLFVQLSILVLAFNIFFLRGMVCMSEELELS
jgi:hypothetical protein